MTNKNEGSKYFLGSNTRLIQVRNKNGWWQKIDRHHGIVIGLSKKPFKNIPAFTRYPIKQKG